MPKNHIRRMEIGPRSTVCSKASQGLCLPPSGEAEGERGSFLFLALTVENGHRIPTGYERIESGDATPRLRSSFMMSAV